MSKARDLAAMISRSADLKAGTTAFFAMNAAPTGWLKANGAVVSRSVYADLFSAIGTTFGVGDGSTTFALPDLRGEFPRGFDDGRGADSGRAFGSAQLGSLEMFSPDHMVLASNNKVDFDDPGTTIWIDHEKLTGSTDNGWLNPIPQANFTSNFGRTRPRNVALLACIKY